MSLESLLAGAANRREQPGVLDHDRSVQGEAVALRDDPLAVPQQERPYRPDGLRPRLANPVVCAERRHAASPVRSSALAISWANSTCSSAAAGMRRWVPAPPS